MTTATGIAPDDALLGKWARLTDSESGVCLLQVRHSSTDAREAQLTTRAPGCD